jgi:AcrR family transcriptional regulator
VRAKRRIGGESSATRTLLLDATEQLMLELGYGSVSTRKVAAKVGLTPALVHYYFPTTDDLFLAVYRRVAEQNLERLTEAVASDRPLRTLWNLSKDPTRTGLGMELMALANHRSLIRDEIASYVTRFRELQAKTLGSTLSAAALDPTLCPPIAITLIIAAISRALVMENALGIAAGHDEVTALMERWIDHLEQAVQP